MRSMILSYPCTVPVGRRLALAVLVIGVVFAVSMAVPTTLEAQGISTAAAAELYGVVIENGEVDDAKTQQLRAQREPATARGIGVSAQQSEFEATWTRANYAVLTAVLRCVPVHWRFFLKHQIFDAISALPAAQCSGGAVLSAFREISARYPELQDCQPELPAC